MGENQLAFLVLCCLHIHLNLVTYLYIGIVAEFRDIDDTLALVPDIDEHLALSDCHHCSFNHLILHYFRKSLIVLFLIGLAVGLR